MQINSSTIESNILSQNLRADSSVITESSKQEEEAETSSVDHGELHQDPLKRGLSDKSFKKELTEEEEDKLKNSVFFTWLHRLEGLSTYAALGVNLLGAVLMQLNLSDGLKRAFVKFTDFLTNMSFIPYGLDGIRIGIKKQNPYQAFGYLLELSTVWLSDIKTKYLIRGAGTGTDQIWVATDHKDVLGSKYPEGRFDNWYSGLTEVPKACLQLFKEFLANPISTVFTTKSKGHKAMLSSFGDIFATLGYAITGNEKIFGTIRDVAGMLFDAEMLFKDKLIEKLSGILFITESTLDYLARYAKNEWAKLTLNMLAHASGRSALMCYKNSDPNASKIQNS